MREGDRTAVCHPEFLQDPQHWVETDRRTAKRLLELVQAILRDPFDGIGKPEPLRHALAGWWSRRIDDTHRIVYRVEDGRLLIAQLRHSFEQGCLINVGPDQFFQQLSIFRRCADLLLNQLVIYRYDEFSLDTGQVGQQIFM